MEDQFQAAILGTHCPLVFTNLPGLQEQVTIIECRRGFEPLSEAWCAITRIIDATVRPHA